MWSSLVLIAMIVLSMAVVVRAADTLPAELTGEGLVMRFDNRTATPAGVLRFKDQSYPFAGAFKDNKLVGTFEAGGNSHPFVMSQEGDRFVLETGGVKYALTAKVAAAAAARNPLGANPQEANEPAAKPNAGGAASGAAAAVPAGAVVLEPQVLRDPTTKLDVATLMVPRGWTLNPEVWWRPLAAQFVCLTSSVFDRQSGWALRWLPMDRFNCCPTLAANARQQGVAPVSGGLELVDRVPGPQEYVRSILLPRYRRVPGLRVIGGEDLKEMTAQVEQARAFERRAANQTGHEMRLAAARVRVEYPGPGDVMLQEDIYCVLQVLWSVQGNANARALNQPGLESYLFYPDQLYSFTAPKGQLEAATPLLQAILSSTRPTLRWHAYIANLNQIIQKIAIDQHAMEMAARAEITESQRQTWAERCASADKISQQVGHLMSATQAFKNPDPAGPQIVVPAKTNAWINEQGQVIYSGSNVFDPNKEPGNTHTWSALKPEP